MPTYYNGTHTGAQIDTALDVVEQRSGELVNGGNGLVKSYAVYNEIGNKIVKITFSNITGNGIVEGNVFWTPPLGANTYYINVTEDCEVLSYTFSNPAAVMGDWTITVGNNNVAYSGSLNGTTDLTVILGKIIGKWP